MFAWPLFPDDAGGLHLPQSWTLGDDELTLGPDTMLHLASALGKMLKDAGRVNIESVDVESIGGRPSGFTHHLTFTGKHWHGPTDWAVILDARPPGDTLATRADLPKGWTP